MKIERFDMERTQCLYENEIRYNLSESGVLPMSIEEVCGDAIDPSSLHRLRLKYPQSNGSPELRGRIAHFYGGGVTADNVTVVNGGSEANYLACWALLSKGDRAACMIPNYLQTRGLARAYGSGADPFRLVERRGSDQARWALDIKGLRRAVSRRTRLIVVTNPNNPTGAVLTDEEMDAVVREARRVNAWILADEIYRGAELSGPMTPSFQGRYEKTLITSGLSKAFGLPGLRIGWIVGPQSMIRKLHGYHDYLTLTPTILSERLASIAMDPKKRDEILERTRRILRTNLPVLEEWIGSRDDALTCIPPVAGAIAVVKYRVPVGSTALFNRLRLEKSVLITPGSHFGFGRYIRIGYGYDLQQLREGLACIDPVLRQSGAARLPGAARRTKRRRDESRVVA